MKIQRNTVIFLYVSERLERAQNPQMPTLLSQYNLNQEDKEKEEKMEKWHLEDSRNSDFYPSELREFLEYDNRKKYLPRY